MTGSSPWEDELADPPQRWQAFFFDAGSGRFPARDFLEGLPSQARAGAIALIRLVEERGVRLRRPHSGSLGDGLFELRDVGTGVRLFYCFQPGRRIVLLDGMVKKRGDIPPRTLKQVRAWKAELDARER